MKLSLITSLILTASYAVAAPIVHADTAAIVVPKSTISEAKNLEYREIDGEIYQRDPACKRAPGVTVDEANESGYCSWSRKER
ncbi:hypothetical protein BP6252_09650 [Coleophoma cylindrospora]|uniref:Uncharacterized protein n=1 Tax=Coleophoma cylindrospora TaxID=1849047 RepID=A0A3D8QW65_9HELO|nr:hypothetical protein BP6252_09650 [Coleophoma cylindrospora]